MKMKNFMPGMILRKMMKIAMLHFMMFKKGRKLLHQVMILLMTKIQIMSQLLMNLTMNLKNAMMILKPLQKLQSVEISDQMI